MGLSKEFTDPPHAMQKIVSGGPCGLGSLSTASQLPWDLFLASLCGCNCEDVYSATEDLYWRGAESWASPAWPKPEQHV